MLEKLKAEAEHLFRLCFFPGWFEISGMSRISRPKEGDQVFDPKKEIKFFSG